VVSGDFSGVVLVFHRGILYKYIAGQSCMVICGYMNYL